jgi:hypothetical protein
MTVDQVIKFLQDSGEPEMALTVERLRENEIRAIAAADKLIWQMHLLKNGGKPRHEFQGPRFVGD